MELIQTPVFRILDSSRCRYLVCPVLSVTEWQTIEMNDFLTRSFKNINDEIGEGLNWVCRNLDI